MFAGYMKLLTIEETQSHAWHSNSLFVLGVFTKQQAHSTTLCLSHMLLHSKCPDELIASCPLTTYYKTINDRRHKNTGWVGSNFLKTRRLISPYRHSPHSSPPTILEHWSVPGGRTSCSQTMRNAWRPDLYWLTEKGISCNQKRGCKELRKGVFVQRLKSHCKCSSLLRSNIEQNQQQVV